MTITYYSLFNYYQSHAFSQINMAGKKASIIREAVENYLEERKNIDWNNDPFFKTVGIMESVISNLSKNHDRYLYNNQN